MARKTKTDNEIVVSAGAAPARRKTATPRPRRAATTKTATATPAEPEAVVVPSVVEPTREAIAALAYSYWEARGYQGGSEREDWLRAEQELRGRRAVAATA
jgi:putative hemolysin